MTIAVKQRVKDGAGHFGTVLAVREQPKAARGDAAFVRWEQSTRQDSWVYVADLTPVRQYGARRHMTVEDGF